VLMKENVINTVVMFQTDSNHFVKLRTHITHII